MRILRLTNSYDTDPAISVEDNKSTLCELLLAERTGETVETTSRIIWPDPVLPELIQKWMERYQPDVVLLVVSSYWFTYVSAPLRVERSLGPLGRRLAAAGQKVAGTPWIAHNAPFRLLRRATLGVIGGTTFFTPEEVNESMEACVRAIVAREGTALAVRGPRVPHAAEGTGKAVAWAEQRRRRVHFHMKQLCERVHVPYQGWDTSLPAHDRRHEFQGDLVHGSPSIHRQLAQEEAELILEALHGRTPMLAPATSEA